MDDLRHLMDHHPSLGGSILSSKRKFRNLKIYEHVCLCVGRETGAKRCEISQMV